MESGTDGAGAGPVPVANPAVVLCGQPGDRAILYNPDTSEALDLDPVGVAVWKLLDGRRTVGAIASSVGERFAAVPDEAPGEIAAFLARLAAGGFVGSVEGGGGVASPRPSPGCDPDPGSRLLLRGGSMAPTLREGDLLRLDPPAGAPARVGDVIAFRAGGGAGVVVHRVVGIAGGLLTRGDGARGEDGGAVAPDCVLGRVVSARRGNRDITVAGGRRGRARGALARLGNAVFGTAAALLRPLRVFLPPPGWAGGLLPPSARPRVVRFESPGRVERRVFVAGRVAGHYDAAGGTWRIRARYRPFVRPERLPGA